MSGVFNHKLKLQCVYTHCQGYGNVEVAGQNKTPLSPNPNYSWIVNIIRVRRQRNQSWLISF